MTHQHIYLIGMPGSGKTTLGQMLAASLALPFADLDARIEALYGMPISRIFAERGEPAFRQMESETLALCASESPQVIATGGGAVLRKDNVTLMRATGTVLWIDRPLERILGDLHQDTRPLLAGDAAGRLRALHSQREALYRSAAHHRLDNSGTEERALQSALTIRNKLQTMTYDDFIALLNGPHAPYYAGRWEYLKEVISIIKSRPYQNIVELGPGHIPVVKYADIILNPLDDQFGKPPEAHGHVYTFDATQKPWPIQDNAYDLFVALQVWEHLDNKQSRAFREVMRIAKAAVLSFPYQWDGGKEKSSHRAHRDIDLALINDWTLGITPTKTIEIPRTGPEFSKGPRMICFWEFETLQTHNSP